MPTAFISSTLEDLKLFRAAVDAVVSKNGFHGVMCEHFAASERPPLPECLDRVAGRNGNPPIDVLVVIVAERYGWVPPDQTDPKDKSITWLECLEAERCKIPILVFLLDPTADWDLKWTEAYRLAAAALAGKTPPIEEVQRNMTRLKDFKVWVDERCTRVRFKNPDHLASQVGAGLSQWRLRHPEFQDLQLPGDPTRYLRAVEEETALLEIRGLVGDPTAKTFAIEDLYIPLRSTAMSEHDEKDRENRRPLDQEARGERLDLDRALAQPRLVVVGDPGAGKTTFLRRVAHLASRAHLQADASILDPLGLKGKPFPIFVKLWELQQHGATQHERQDGPSLRDDPLWLPHYLASRWGGGDARLDQDFWIAKLSGGALLLLDGLDEAPSDKERKVLRRCIEQAAARWPETRMVVTSRPAAYVGEAVLSGFAHAWIDSLDDEAIETFLSRWSDALFPSSPERAEMQRDQVLKSLTLSPIRRLARNPVMLTALAVIHWNEKRLPEQRAELYESILKWLSRSRADLERRQSPERALELLQALALQMQNADGGRQVQVPLSEAAQALAPLFVEVEERQRLRTAERFLSQEENDSGIVAGRGNEIRFWQLTFQEYLAARALAGLPDADQHDLLPAKLHETEWREVVLLFFGVLHKQGAKKVDALFKAVLDALGDQPPLAEAARCAGLLGSVLRDLAPLKCVVRDERYARLMERVLQIFDKERSQGVLIGDAIEAAEALGQAGDPRFAADRLDKNWVEIPAGEFWMGAQSTDSSKANFDADAADREGPVRRVHLSAYRIGCYPVTVGEYFRFVGDDGYTRDIFWEAGGFRKYREPLKWESQLEHLTRPVGGVSWFEASAYARWAKARLPTEAEWERAARGSRGRRYPWGNEDASPERLNFAPSGIGEATPVGVYPLGATQDGSCDLAGNVLEWCSDWFGPYAAIEAEDPTGLAEGVCRSLRGGAWFYSARYCRSSDRYRNQPVSRNVYIGFRVVFLGSQD